MGKRPEERSRRRSENRVAANRKVVRRPLSTWKVTMKRMIAVVLWLLAGAVIASAQDSVVPLLEKLTNAPGPSGYEEPVTRIMVQEMRPLADNISYDGIGSVIAVQGRTGPKIMLDAHMDELGGLIRRVTPNG